MSILGPQEPVNQPSTSTSLESLLESSRYFTSNLQIANVMGNVPMALHSSPPVYQCHSSLHNCCYCHAPHMYAPMHRPLHRQLLGHSATQLPLTPPQFCMPCVYFPSPVGSPNLAIPALLPQFPCSSASLSRLEPLVRGYVLLGQSLQMPKTCV